MDDRQKAQSEKPPEQEAFTQALSLALSVSKLEIQERISKSAPESVSCYDQYKFVPAKRPRS